MKWSSDPPASEGWYWVRGGDYSWSPRIIEVMRDKEGIHCFVHGGWFGLAELNAEWAGPLEPPKDHDEDREAIYPSCKNPVGSLIDSLIDDICFLFTKVDELEQRIRKIQSLLHYRH